MHARLRPLLLVALLGAAHGACASGGASGGAGAPATSAGATAGAPAAEQSPPRQARAPLAPFRARPLVVVPVQRLRAGDPLGWAAAGGDARAQLATLDSAIARRLAAEGVTWSVAADVERMARRNPTMMPDPHALVVDELLARRQPEQLSNALGSQLRAIVALGGQRYVLVPAELRYVRRDDGRGQAVLRVTLVDARTAAPLWTIDVHGDPADAHTRALLESVAAHFAYLISPPDEAPGA